MARQLNELAAEALEMTREARAALALRLLDSLEDQSIEGLGDGWIAEAERRHEELKAGKALSVPSEEVFARLESRSRK